MTRPTCTPIHLASVFRLACPVAVLTKEPYRLCDLYAPGLPKVALLEHTLQGLLNTTMPQLAAHLNSFNVHPTMYAAPWFLTVFTYTMPFALGTFPSRTCASRCRTAL